MSYFFTIPIQSINYIGEKSAAYLLSFLH